MGRARLPNLQDKCSEVIRMTEALSQGSWSSIRVVNNERKGEF